VFTTAKVDNAPPLERAVSFSGKCSGRCKNRLEKNDLKKFLLNCSGVTQPRADALLTPGECDSICRSDRPQNGPNDVRQDDNKSRRSPNGCRGSDAMKSGFNRSILALAVIVV